MWRRRVDHWNRGDCSLIVDFCGLILVLYSTLHTEMKSISSNWTIYLFRYFVLYFVKITNNYLLPQFGLKTELFILQYQVSKDCYVNNSSKIHNSHKV